MSTPAPALRFALMCSGPVLSAWEARCLDLLLATARVQLALLITNADPPNPPTKIGQIRKLVSGHLNLWDVYQKLHVRSRSLALQPTDLTDLLAGVPRIACTVQRRGKASEYFQANDIAEIKRFDLDFILRFAFGIIRGDILTAARFGVWSFHHDDEQRYRGGPPGFWELFYGDRVTGAMLQRLTKRLDAGVVLHKGVFRTCQYSYVKNLDTILFGGASWPARMCQAILAGGGEFAFPSEPCRSRAQIYRRPSNGQFLLFLARQSAKRLSRKVSRLLKDAQWNVGVVEAPIQDFLDEAPEPVRWLPDPPRRGRFFADPFGATEKGRLYLLVEDFDYSTGKGTIASIEVKGDGGGSEPKPVLDPGVHASYPYLLQENGCWYCVPETHGSKEVVAYKATEFPWRWERWKTLIKGVAALDPTLFVYRGRWWLLCSLVEEASGFQPGNRDVRLYGWWAEELSGQWQAHALNPLKTDVRSSRPAGTPFWHEGHLFRPAQDVSQGYGGGVVLNRIVQLEPNRFEEEVVAAVGPYRGTAYGDGLHHLAAAGERTIVDGQRRLFIWDAVKVRLARRAALLASTLRLWRR